jgi:hypothetical protein
MKIFIVFSSWILNFFHAADKDKSRSLTKKECRHLLRDSFHVEMPDHLFEQLFMVEFLFYFIFIIFIFRMQIKITKVL